MTATLTRRIEQIEKLRFRTTERAASPSEETTAATTIGKILMRNSDLRVVEGVERQSEPQVEITGEAIMLHEVTLRRRTSKAVLVQLDDGRALWFPLSQIIEADWPAGELTVTAWIWRQKRQEAGQ